jgi:hypothetical protein
MDRIEKIIKEYLKPIRFVVDDELYEFQIEEVYYNPMTHKITVLYKRNPNPKPKTVFDLVVK